MRRRRKPTLIIVWMTLTEPKAPLAGVMPNTSFAIFMASMAAFNKERVVSGRFGRCGFVSMAEARGCWEKRRGPGPHNLDERPFCRTSPRTRHMGTESIDRRELSNRLAGSSWKSYTTGGHFVMTSPVQTESLWRWWVVGLYLCRRFWIPFASLGVASAKNVIRCGL